MKRPAPSTSCVKVSCYTRPSLPLMIPCRRCSGCQNHGRKVRADPENLGSKSLHLWYPTYSHLFAFPAVTCFNGRLSQSQVRSPGSPQDAVSFPTAPTSPTISETDTNDSDALTVVNPPALISKFEMKYWYHGISSNPPELLWRSDLETQPFPNPRAWSSLLQNLQKDCPRCLQLRRSTPHGILSLLRS